MFISITPKKINDAKKITIFATFEHQGVKFEERYTSKKKFLYAVKRTKYKFVDAVDFNLMTCIYPHTLKEYENGH